MYSNKQVNKYKQANKLSKRITKDRKDSKLSKGELRIATFLGKECIEFEREYYIKGLYGKAGHFLYFDFYLPEYNLAIEFDGIFHYEKAKGNQLENDFRKVAFCKMNNVNLLRIKYTDYHRIEDLILAKVDQIAKPLSLNNPI
jgi:very-short-patch-repair endonuclease